MPVAPWIADAGKQLAGQAGAAAGSGILGMVFGGWNDRRQLRQQEKLNELNRKNIDYNMKKQLEMWEATGYVGQKRQMEEAGLNPGLMYGMGGGGGQSANVATSQAASAPSGGGEMTAAMGMGLQMQLLKAQKENIEADTQKKKADAAATAGVQTDVGRQAIEQSKALTEQLLQGVDNARMDYEIKKLDISMKNIQNFEAQSSQGDRLGFITYNAEKAGQELRRILNENYITSKTLPDRIKIIQQEAIGAVIKNEAMKTGIAVDQQKIKESVNQIMQGWDSMDQKNRELMMKKVLNDYNTDPVNDMLGETVDAVGDIMKMRLK